MVCPDRILANDRDSGEPQLKAQVHAGVADQERISGSLAELEAYRAKLPEEYTVKLTGSDTWMKAE
jgi:hypothetical protein